MPAYCDDCSDKIREELGHKAMYERLEFEFNNTAKSFFRILIKIELVVMPAILLAYYLFDLREIGFFAAVILAIMSVVLFLVNHSLQNRAEHFAHNARVCSEIITELRNSNQLL